ncbi:hypothetical protein SAMN04488030_0024 [Aliiroseovarius halocynthiae]|uniref:Uncharacterized protein n=1 Tax=Aliiroseovarius halocynthiae TaxID=985055 RepID=A0A545SLE7_9RHOB|nr:hypothetical protein [Aliiroseovarius halocynthiae]TQV65782.1 hypothetical protein FIL88_15905 [Aliiroseovarius halocynthiae]SMR83549.1 hypothetical protein SAMN04488030_0024 [Aliiroseovarius halocynthiae]
MMWKITTLAIAFQLSSCLYASAAEGELRDKHYWSVLQRLNQIVPEGAVEPHGILTVAVKEPMFLGFPVPTIQKEVPLLWFRLSSDHGGFGGLFLTETAGEGAPFLFVGEEPTEQVCTMIYEIMRDIDVSSEVSAALGDVCNR